MQQNKAATHKWPENDGRPNLFKFHKLSLPDLLRKKPPLLTIHGVSVVDFGPCPSDEELILLLMRPRPFWVFKRACIGCIDVRRETRAAREAKAILLAVQQGGTDK
jgi:hypothetical protein